MPFSSPSGKKIIIDWLSVQRSDIFSMIDFGAGAGYYGKLFIKLLPTCRRDAVEVFEPYIEKYCLSTIYEIIYIEDASRMALPSADLAVFGDIIEHMTKDVAINFIKRIEAQYHHIIVSIPIGSYPQGASEGNDFERHLSTWSFSELCEIFKNFKIQTSDKEIAVFIKNI